MVLLKWLYLVQLENTNCPREKHPEAFRLGAKESTVSSVHGRIHIFSSDMQSKVILRRKN